MSFKITGSDPIHRKSKEILSQNFVKGVDEWNLRQSCLAATVRKMLVK